MATATLSSQSGDTLILTPTKVNYNGIANPYKAYLASKLRVQTSNGSNVAVYDSLPTHLTELFGSAISLELPDSNGVYQTAVLHPKTVRLRTEKDFIILYRSDSLGHSLSYSVTDETVYMYSVRDDGKYISVSIPLPGELTVLYPVLSGTGVSCGMGTGGQIANECVTPVNSCPEDLFDNSQCEGDCPATIDILFAVSPNANGYWSNDPDIVFLEVVTAINQLQTIFLTNNISHVVNYSVEFLSANVPFEDSQDCAVFSQAIACNNTMQSLRNQAAVDIVVYVDGESTFDAGYSSACVTQHGVIDEAAYVYLPADVLDRGLVFTYEIGHIFGARHNANGSGGARCCGSGRRISAPDWPGQQHRTLMF